MKNYNYKNKLPKIVLLIVTYVSFVFSNSSFGQDAAKLNIGDNAPALVLTSTNNSIQSFSFPYQNKITLLFFWSSSVSKSKENIYKYKKIYNKYADIGYKMCDGFEMVSVALQSDKVVWSQDLVKYDLLKVNNCIAQKGYSDMFVKNYKITETPSSFLIDELGKIVAINPSVKTILSYLDSKRNVELSTDVQTKLSGKIMFGNGTLTALTGERISLLNDKKDTIQSIILDEKGSFLIKNINTQSSMSIVLKSNSKITDEQNVFLVSDNGEIVSTFTKSDNGYEYNLVEGEMTFLKPLFDNEPSVKPEEDKSIKELFMVEHLFSAKETVLSKDAMAKLNAVIVKLKENPKTKLEILTHTDCNGDAKLNAGISLKQSNSISVFISSKGIAKTRITAIGKGEEIILNKCKDGVPCSEEEHKKNRRTEFKFYPL